MPNTNLRAIATEAAELHEEFITLTQHGNDKDVLEKNLLDPASDPGDVRYGKESLLYAEAGGTFAGWLKRTAQKAYTFTATHDLMHEVLLTQQMMVEEGIDWLPLLPHHLPSEHGFMLFPWGIEVPCLTDGDKALWDRWMIDGFMWSRTTMVARDGGRGEPVDGVIVFPLTRYRGRDADRPFVPEHLIKWQPQIGGDQLICSDLTAWSFDEVGSTEWDSIREIFTDAPPPNMDIEHTALGFNRSNLPDLNKDDITDEWLETFWRQLEDLRLWTRSLFWSCWRWMTEEVWLDGDLSRPVRRRLKRAKPVLHENQPDDGNVIVVELRQERKDAIERGETSGEPPWWRTRWIVRGHWAKRRYAIKDAQGNNVGPVRGPDSIENVTFYYDHVWIEPYEKGPDNAPLVMRDPVGVLCR